MDKYMRDKEPEGWRCLSAIFKEQCEAGTVRRGMARRLQISLNARVPLSLCDYTLPI